MRIFILIIFLYIGISACENKNYKVLTIGGLTMGTTYSIKIKITNIKINRAQIQTDIEKILYEVNQAMSTYLKESELSYINSSTNIESHPISNDLYMVINHADTVSQLTNGAFDVTVGTLVNLWGFGPIQSTNQIPSNEAIKSIKNNTGYQKIYLNKSQRSITKLHPDLYIDLSGIAKGFAVDKIALYLDENGFENYLVEIGGELIAKGFNENNKIWQIGIESPNNNIMKIIGLKDIAMATSGNYKNYFEKDGVRYSHTINPNTGKPIKHKLASVTVVDKSAMNADALATAFMVLGPEKTLLLANDLEIGVYLIIKNDERFYEDYNEYFKPYLTN